MMRQFLLGLTVMACLAIGLIFLRAWRRMGDRLFATFALAFWLLGLNWLLLATTHEDEASVPVLYLIRLGAFVLMLYGIWDKNRGKGRV